jgi:hypothetical protein
MHRENRRHRAATGTRHEHESPGFAEVSSRTMLLLAMNNRRPGQALTAALGCLLLFAALRCEAQGNLVPNGSFELLEEDCDSLQCCFNVGSRPLHWYSWQNSPEYFNACATDSLVDVPQNGMAYQQAADGQAYVGFYAYQPTAEYREYVGVELIDPMVPGVAYNVSFRLNLAWDGNYWGGSDGGCNNVGALFSMVSNAWLGISGPAFGFRNYAHVHSTAILTDTANWVLVSGTFIADSAYQHLVMGNFFDNDNTDVMHIPPPGTVGAVYVLVDEVCVSAGGEGCVMTALPETGIGNPTCYWNWLTQEVVLEWQGTSGFGIEIFDAIGRRVLGPIIAPGQQARVSSLALSTGWYVVRTFAGEKLGSTKFVVTR